MKSSISFISGLIALYILICAVCFLTPFSHKSKDYVMENYEMLKVNFYPGHKFWKVGNTVYVEGNYIIETFEYKQILNTNKYSIINLSELSDELKNNIVDTLPANALAIPLNGVTSLPVGNYGGLQGNGAPSNTQLKDIAAKIPEEIFAVWINFDFNLYVIDNRDKNNPKLFKPKFFSDSISESDKRAKNLWKAVLIANIEDFLTAPYTTARALIYYIALGGLRGING